MKPLIVPFFIPHHGCPQQCVYCEQRSITGQSGELPSAAEINATIASYRSSSRREVVEVAFFGGSFTSLPLTLQKALLEPLQQQIENGKISAVRVSARPDAIDVATAKFLQEKGVAIVELGIQSMCDDVLQASGRGHTAAHVVDAVDILRMVGMRVGAQLMLGLPGDTEQKSILSMQRVLALKPHFIRLYPTLVLSGTELAEMYRQGSYAPLDLDSAVRLCKKLLHAALLQQVPVIRVGLQPTDELSAAGVVMAGPYHPAFRQLVEGELYFDLLCKLAYEMPAAASVTVNCAATSISTVVGQNSRNVRQLQKLLHIPAINVYADNSLALHQVRLAAGNLCRTGSIAKDLIYPEEGSYYAN